MPTPATRLLFNESLSFPAFGMGSNEDGTFDMPDDAADYVLRLQAFADCAQWPVVYVAEARLVVEAPDGNQTEFLLDPQLGGANYAEGCGSAAATQEKPYPQQEHGSAAVTGAWTVRTTGEFTGRVQVQAISDPT